MGTTGRTLNWIQTFIFDRYIQVKMGTTTWTRYKVDNGAPQGSVISPILFSIMIKDVYSDISSDIGKASSADDGASWTRGKNLTLIQEKIGNVIRMVEKCSYSWGFRFSVEKTKVVMFCRKKMSEAGLKMNVEQLDQVNTFQHLGFYLTQTWNEHRNKREEKRWFLME